MEFIEFPKHRHHTSGKWKEVKNQEEQDRLTPDNDGWSDLIGNGLDEPEIFDKPVQLKKGGKRQVVNTDGI